MRIFVLLLLLGAVPAWSQSNVEFANLREDVRLLLQRVGDLSLRVEQLERENAQLRQQSEGTSRNFATLAQLNEAVAEMNRTLKATVAASRSDTLDTVSRQMDRLAQQTDVAIQALARGQSRSASVQTSFSDDFPKEGISYTVQRGDSLALIARKTNSKVQDIVNANKITDASKINPGQVLFIPGGK